MTPSREDAIAGFLAAHGWGDAGRTPLAGDASARRYVRLHRGTDSVLLMDSPNPAEDVIPFVAISGLLRGLGLSAPGIVAEQPDAGLLLIEDFGDATFTRLMDRGADPADLYRLAVDAIIELHRRFDPAQASAVALPRYDAALFIEQVMLLADVYIPAALGRAATAEERADLERAWWSAVPDAVGFGTSLMHRDYHVDNLMRLDGRPGAYACGLLDFQNAGLGPTSYDLVSLLEDARRDVPAALAAAMLDHYLDAFPDLDRAAFRRSYAVLGAVRHTRIVAVFARLHLRDGRSDYLRHLPRVWRLLEAKLRHPALAPVRDWFDRTLPPPVRAPLFNPPTDIPSTDISKAPE
ncbi:phosphotransferase [Skermanella mucosa]|uniref:aminoglycoside phosphotransferase family protein n=1 Tax=Skermanella mucosa TaxID=1789672 RepID=UPI001E521765|nr:phosphotransferase [Skermanella mucosa]UEM22676.1 phosphotransferase [Skermanella mucosa]